MARGKSTVLTDKQHAYAEARLDGKSKNESKRVAGYSDKNKEVEKSRDVTQYIADRQGELVEMTQIRRVDVLNMLKDAYDMAKQMAEPSTMVSAAKEIGKMLGFYEPETIKVELSTNQSNIQRKLMTMSDEELLRIASGTAKVIEGEAEHVH